MAVVDPDHKEGHDERPLGRTNLAGPASKDPGTEEGISDAAGLKVRLAVRGNQLRELTGELAEARSHAGEFRAARENLEERIRALSNERDRLTERVRDLEDEVRRQNRGRENLERESGEREAKSEELRAALEELRKKLEDEYELRRSLAEPGNRLRAGIELFNESEHLGSVGSLSRSMGQPEVHATLGPGEESAAGCIWGCNRPDRRRYVSFRLSSRSSGNSLSPLSSFFLPLPSSSVKSFAPRPRDRKSAVIRFGPTTRKITKSRIRSSKGPIRFISRL